jgi:hypothetical protein
VLKFTALEVHYGFIDCIIGFHLNSTAPPIMPRMKPIMNPPPVITLSSENAIIIILHAFIFSGLMRSIIAPNNTRTPQISPTDAIAENGTVALFSDPGRVGKIQGNNVPATPTATAFQTIKTPEARDNVKAFVDFLIWFNIKSHS